MSTSTKLSTRARILAPAAALLATAIPVAARTAAAQAETITTRVIVLHAGVDTGKIEVHINGDEALDEFEYGDQSDWIDLDPGTARFTITADRAGFNYVLFDGVYPVPAGNDYYVVITDALILSGAFDTEGVAAGEARAQFLHASVDTPALAVHVTGDGVDETVQVAYAGKTESVAGPAGTYTLEASLADGGDPLLSGEITTTEGASSLVIAIGDPNSDDKPLELVVLETGTSTGSATPVS